MPRRRKESREKTFDLIVGSLIAAARLRKKCSMSRLAKGLGIGRQLLYKYETGIVSCPLVVAAQITESLEIDLAELLPKNHKKLQTLQSRQKTLK